MAVLNPQVAGRCFAVQPEVRQATIYTKFSGGSVRLAALGPTGRTKTGTVESSSPWTAVKPRTAARASRANSRVALDMGRERCVINAMVS